MRDTLGTRRTLRVGEKSYDYFSIQAAGASLGRDLGRLPVCLKILLENLLRHEDARTVTTDDVKAVPDWLDARSSTREIAYRPARVLMQDFTGVPAVVDLAAMRDAVRDLGGEPEKINPLTPVDLVIDHSVMVDHFGHSDSFAKNVHREMERNRERYEFLRWGREAFDNFRVVPPGTGICHQVNLEFLAKVVWTGGGLAYPDTLVGTDSHTTMINGLAVLGWGVGGIEAEAAILGQPISMVIPEVIGFRLTGRLREGTTATDLVLSVTRMLRERGVVGKFVEFYGPGFKHLPVADRATLANMAPEYGATCGFFPIDGETIRYLRLSAREDETIALVEAYAKEQGLWHSDDGPDPVFTDTLELNMADVRPSIAGPKRPQDKVLLSSAAAEFKAFLGEDKKPGVRHKVGDFDLGHGDIVIAAITSCTNTSNPGVMIAAGLVAKKALEKGLKVKPWVKTSLAPGSKVVTEYLSAAGLRKDLDALGFNLVGYGCTTCIGNSGPLDPGIETAIRDHDLTVTSVLSGNRNFEGRVHSLTRGNYLMSPPLVVAYAVAGSMAVNMTADPLGKDPEGREVFLRDIWPTNREIAACAAKALTPDMFRTKYTDVFTGTAEWREIAVSKTLTFPWSEESTYIRNPPYFKGMTPEAGRLKDIREARVLALLGDSITTDHISPAGAISPDSPAAGYLRERGVNPGDFNSYGSRRGNHEVMMRGTFANVRIRNEMAPGTEGGFTVHLPGGEVMTIYDAAMRYGKEGVPLVVVAGKDYGMGSSRDWAAKGAFLLGVKAVLAESFERIHRSNLVGMGVLPLAFPAGVTRKTLALNGTEIFSITGLEGGIEPGMDAACAITRKDGTREEIRLLCRIDTADEVGYYKNGGILHKVIRDLVSV